MKLLRVCPGFILNLSEIREIVERDCGIYITFVSGTVKYYPDICVSDIWDKLLADEDFIPLRKD